MPCPPRIWTISDRHAGNRNQAAALAAALGGAEQHVELEFAAPWRWLAPRLVGGALAALPLTARAALQSDPPEIAIGCGRQAALALRVLKRALGKRVFTVQILDPRIATGAFDRVIAPRHDRLHADNAIASIGALHAIDADWIARARADFPALAALPRPLTVVLIGGPHRHAGLDAVAIGKLSAALAAHHAQVGGTIHLLGSRRTPTTLAAALRRAAQALAAPVWLDAGDGPNPYRGLLAHADQVLVTADSVGMLSEACALGVPVTSFCAYPLRGKLARFDAALRAAGLLSDLADPQTPTAPLRETAAIAAQVFSAWQGQGRGERG
ncbi:MAG: mitochondrial fission ELM1 family protein [Porticoccaceae bacterium]